MNNHSFKNVPRGSRLNIDIRQEGEGHAVSGHFARDNKVLHTWAPGDLEDKVTAITLSDTGVYILFLQVHFFGPTEDGLVIELIVDGPNLYSDKHQFLLKGRPGMSQAIFSTLVVD